MKNLRKLGVSLIAILSLAGCTSKSPSRSSSKSSGEVSSSVSGSSSSSSAASSASSAPTSAGSSSSAGSSVITSSSSSSSGTSSTSSSSAPIEPQGVTFSFSARVAEYEAKGYSGVVIPDYECADSSATLSAIEGHDGYYLIKPSSAAEMETFVASFSSAWEDYPDSYGDHYLYLGSPEPGESCPFIYVADYTAESLAGIVLCFDEYTEPVPAAAFPLEEVNAYLAENAASYGFTLSQEEADALSALSTSFVFQSGTDSYGYPIAYVIMVEGIAEAAIAVIESTITAAGFAWEADYEAYMNEDYYFIYAAEQDGATYLVFN